MPDAMEKAKFVDRYTRTQIVLHWLVVLLIVGQWYTSSAIPRTLNPLLPPSKADLFQQAVHTYSGLLIGAAMAVRFGLSRLRNLPPLPNLPKWQNRSARVMHWGLYFSVSCQVAAGVVTSYFWAPARVVHAFFWDVILILAFFHIAAAAYHLVCGDGVFRRMMPRLR